MLSNVEINEQRRANEKQLATESTDEVVTELVVIGIDFQAQTRQAIIAVVERVRHVKFRKWIEDEMAPVNLNDPMSAMTPSFDTKTEYRATNVDCVEYSDVIEHLLGIIKKRPIESRVIVTLEVSGVGHSVIPLLRSVGISHIVPLTITDGFRVERKKGGYEVPLDRLNAHLTDMLASGALRLEQDGEDASGALSYASFVASRSKSVPICGPSTVKTR